QLVRAGQHGPSRARRLAEIVGANGAAERALVAKRIASDGDLQVLLGTTDPRQSACDAIAALAPRADSDPLAASLTIDAQLSLPDDMLHYFDRASMAHSLEVRVPFLDHHFVELCASIPSNLKLHGTQTKHVLRVAARRLVPQEVIE